MRGSLVPFLVPVGVVCSVLTLAAWAQAPQTVTLNPARDNTLYESDTGGLSNGQGVAIFAGRTGPNAGAALRRAVLTFDLSMIPPGSQITTAALQLQNSSSRDTGPQTVSVHRLTQDWGEGPSDASGPEGGGAAAATGDATWVHTFFDTSFWGSPGGDFAETASAQQTVGANGPYVWQSAGLLADVQAWVDGPSSNFGWIVIGEESALGSAKRFNSREAGSGRPTLSVTFVPASQTRPGTVQFTQSVFEVDESDGSAVITVSRSGGTDGTVTLDFATADDSAVAGQDYTATAGTITFADGEGGTQNIQVPVLDDLIFEGVRIVQLTLSNPGGGAQLGEPSEAQLRISDNSDLSFLSYLPQFGNGGGFFSQILLLNAGVQRTATVRIVGHTDQGEPYLLGGGTPGTPILLDTLVEVAADGFALFDTGSNGDLQVGSVTLSSDAPVSAVVVFGGSFGLAGVQASAELSSGFSGPVDTQFPDIRTGIAIQNLGNDPVTIPVDLADASGEVVASASLDIAGLGNTAQFVDEIEWDRVVDFSFFRGSVRVGGQAPLAAMMIQNRIVQGQSQFATLPVVPRPEPDAVASP